MYFRNSNCCWNPDRASTIDKMIKTALCDFAIDKINRKKFKKNYTTHSIDLKCNVLKFVTIKVHKYMTKSQESGQKHGQNNAR